MSPTFPNLERVSEQLRESVDSQTVFNCLNTRLIIQLGVNLKKISAEQAEDQELVKRVLAALAKMGVSMKGSGS
jgi:hypothetical protein